MSLGDRAPNTPGRRAWGSQDRTRRRWALKPDRRELWPGLRGQEGARHLLQTRCTGSLVKRCPGRRSWVLALPAAGTAARGGVQGVLTGGRDFHF